MSKDKLNNGFNAAEEVQRIRDSLKTEDVSSVEETPQLSTMSTSEADKESVNNTEHQQTFRERMEAKLNTKTPLDMKKYLISAGISMGFGITPLVIDRIKNKDKRKKISKRDIFDFACYNIPALIPLIDQAAKGTIFERMAAKAKMALYAAPLIPVAKDLFDKGGIKKENMNFDLLIKTLPFLGNIIVPKIINDTSILASITGLATTFGGPAMMLFMGKTKDKEQIQKISSTASLLVGGLNGLNTMINKQTNAQQINNAFGVNRYNPGFGTNQMASGPSALTSIGQLVNNFSKALNGANPGANWGGNAVYMNQNNRNYWNPI